MKTSQTKEDGEGVPIRWNSTEGENSIEHERQGGGARNSSNWDFLNLDVHSAELRQKQAGGAQGMDCHTLSH